MTDKFIQWDRRDGEDGSSGHSGGGTSAGTVAAFIGGAVVVTGISLYFVSKAVRPSSPRE